MKRHATPTTPSSTQKRPRNLITIQIKDEENSPSPIQKCRRVFFRNPALQRLMAWLSQGLLPITLGILFLIQFPLLMKLGGRALCYADWHGVMEALTRPVPGGLLQWCGDYCAVLFHWPWLGALVFLALNGAVYGIGRKWTRLSPLVAFVPSIQVLLQLTYCGFSVWIFSNAAFPQCYLLEWAAALLALGAIKRFGAAGLLVSLLYPWMGLTLLFGIVGAAFLPKRPLLERLLCVLIPILWVVGWKMGCYADPSWVNLLNTQTWLLFEENARMWDVLAGLALVMVFGEGAIRPKMAQIWLRWPRLSPLLPLLVTLLMIGLTTLLFDPLILYSILACERNLRHGDGQAALALPEKEIIGHRMLSAYYIHAAWRAGKLEEKLFDMPWTVSHQTSTIDTMSLDGYWLLYHYGIVQLARRWCYENVIKLGWNGDNYALLTKIAIVCNEMPLAKRYAEQLKRIPLRRSEAETYLSYIAGSPIPKSDELWRIADLHLRLAADTGSPTFEGGKKLEEGIYNRYAVLKNGSREMVALYLCSSLLLQDTTAFTENFDVILQVWPQRPLPRVFQQALLAAAATLPPDKQPRLTADLFTPGMVEAFQAFQREAPTADPTNPTFRKRFGKSYWYYATFLQ